MPIRKDRRETHPVKAPIALKEPMREATLGLRDVEELLSEAVLIGTRTPPEVLVVDKLEDLKGGSSVPLQVLNEIVDLGGSFATLGHRADP